MEKNNRKIFVLATFLLALSLFFGVCETALSENAPQKPQKQQVKQTTVQKAAPQKTQNAQKPINATALSIVDAPSKYLDKTVKIQATFDKFSALGLDYNKALRPSTKYIGILIQREDVSDHNIPLSEMKLFMKKEMAEKHIDLDTGDKIEITAKVFSIALGDPWLDIIQLNVVKKVKKEEAKN